MPRKPTLSPEDRRQRDLELQRERQKKYQAANPAANNEKQARYRGAEKALREDKRADYDRLLADLADIPTRKRAREAMKRLKARNADRWEAILDAQ